MRMHRKLQPENIKGELRVRGRIILKWISWATESKGVRGDEPVAHARKINAYKIYSENLTWVFESQMELYNN
jgi:hypothetical protein